MAKLNRKKAILAKIETTSGTDSVPTGAANSILVRNLSVTPIEGDIVNRDLIRSYIGNSEEYLVGEYRVVEFDVEIAGAGAAGTAPAYGPLLRACGMAETVTGGVKVEYLPVSSAFETVSIYCNTDGLNHKLTYGMGTVSMDFTAKGIPFFHFRFIGKWTAVTDTALPSQTLTAFQKPLPCSTTNTPTFSFLGVSSLVIESLRIDLNNTLNFRSLIGAEYSQIVDRKATGELMFEAVPVATLDVVSLARTNTTGALQLIHGTTAGNKVQIDAPAVDIGKPTYGESDGVMMISCPVSLTPSSGNDELKITVL